MKPGLNSSPRNKQRQSLVQRYAKSLLLVPLDHKKIYVGEPSPPWSHQAQYQVQNAIPYNMRKKIIFSPVLPKTVQEFENLQPLKDDIFNLESKYLKGRQDKSSRMNRTIVYPLSLQNTPERQRPPVKEKMDKIISESTKPEMERDTSFESLSHALKDRMRQTSVNQSKHQFLQFKTDIKKSIQEVKLKRQKMLDEDEKEPQPKQKQIRMNGLSDGIIDSESLNYVKNEIQSNPEQRNYFEIDKIIQNLRFFTRFPKGVRMGVLENCQYMFKQAGEIIFKQHDIGTEMYIIIRGQVSIRQLQRTSFGEIWDNLIITLYDGQQIGDQSQVENNKRLVSARAMEDSHLLVMQRSQYESVLLKAVEREMEEKIKIILNVKFLKQCMPVQLIPLAAVLECKSFQMGEYLIKQNEKIPCLFFINNGSCDVVHEKRSWRETKNLLLPTQRTRFLFKEHMDASTHYPRRAEIDYEKKSLKLPPNKSFDHTNKQKINENIVEVSEHIQVGTLKNGDVIGGRIVYNYEKIEYKKTKNPNFEQIYGRDMNTAILSVIASSGQVETFTLDHKQFQTLPESLQSQILTGLCQSSEFDEIILGDMIDQHNEWSTLKQAYYKGLIQFKHHRESLGIK